MCNILEFERLKLVGEVKFKKIWSSDLWVNFIGSRDFAANMRLHHPEELALIQANGKRQYFPPLYSNHFL